MEPQVILSILTGNEWHTSSGGYAKVQIGKERVPHFKVAGCATDWDEVVEIGSHGKHGKWIPAQLTLESGTLVYVEGASTWRGHVQEQGRGWFVVDPAAPEIEIGVPGPVPGMVISGHLRRLEADEQKALGLQPVVLKSKHLTVKEA